MAMSRKSKNNPAVFGEKDLRLAEDFPLPTPVQWRKEVEKTLKEGHSLDRLITPTYEGLDLQPLYGPEDIRGLIHPDHFPGFSPFVRGSRAGGHLQQPWQICQGIDVDDAGEFNRILVHDLKRGINAVCLAVSASTPGEREESVATGNWSYTGGVPISFLGDFNTALSGIDLTGFPLFIEAGYTALPLVMMLRAFEEQNGIDLKKIKGSFQADPLGAIALRGRLPVSMESVFDHMAWVLKWVRKNSPGLKTIGVDAGTYFESGATATMELAFALATGVEYISRLMERDISPGDIAGSLRFTFAVGPFFFMEVAKLRAARLLWDAVIREFGGGRDARRMTIHARTAFYNQTRADPHINTLRTTTEALSAVLGGADSLQTNAYDESFSHSDRFSRRLARNIQLILYHEAHLNQPLDPAGGCYYIEKLTSDMAREAWSIFQSVEKKGGMLESLKSGYIQNQVSNMAARKQADVHRLRATIVGSNSYCRHLDSPVDPGESISGARTNGYRFQRLKTHLKSRNEAKCRSALTRLSKALAGDEEHIVGCGAGALANGATIGEILSVLNVENTGSISVSPLKTERLSEPFEWLRAKLDDHVRTTGRRPAVFLVSLGRSSRIRSRLDWSRGILDIAGFGAAFSKEFDCLESSVDETLRSAARAVLVFPDDADPDRALEYISRIKQRDPDMIITLAGYPEKQRSKFQEMGVDGFLYPDVDVFHFLKNLLIKFRIVSG